VKTSPIATGRLQSLRLFSTPPERSVGSCRRDLLDHFIILNERRLKRLMSSYLLYYHEDRTHLGLAKDTPAGHARESRSACDVAVKRTSAHQIQPRTVILGYFVAAEISGASRRESRSRVSSLLSALH
jgi:hypothetical protein